jgi:hypothetical protein
MDRLVPMIDRLNIEFNGRVKGRVAQWLIPCNAIIGNHTHSNTRHKYKNL